MSYRNSYKKRKLVCYICHKIWKGTSSKKLVQSKVCPHCGGQLYRVNDDFRFSDDDQQPEYGAASSVLY